CQGKGRPLTVVIICDSRHWYHQCEHRHKPSEKSRLSVPHGYQKPKHKYYQIYLQLWPQQYDIFHQQAFHFSSSFMIITIMSSMVALSVMRAGLTFSLSTRASTPNPVSLTATTALLSMLSSSVFGHLTMPYFSVNASFSLLKTILPRWMK